MLHLELRGLPPSNAHVYASDCFRIEGGVLFDSAGRTAAKLVNGQVARGGHYSSSWTKPRQSRKPQASSRF